LEGNREGERRNLIGQQELNGGTALQEKKTRVKIEKNNGRVCPKRSAEPGLGGTRIVKNKENKRLRKTAVEKTRSSTQKTLNQV